MMRRTTLPANSSPLVCVRECRWQDLAHPREIRRVTCNHFRTVANVELGKTIYFPESGEEADDMGQFGVGEDWMPLGFSSTEK